MFLMMTCARPANVLLRMNKNLNILKTKIQDLDVLSTPLVDFLKKINQTPDVFFLRKGRGFI